MFGWDEHVQCTANKLNSACFSLRTNQSAFSDCCTLCLFTTYISSVWGHSCYETMLIGKKFCNYQKNYKLVYFCHVTLSTNIQYFNSKTHSVQEVLIFTKRNYTLQRGIVVCDATFDSWTRGFDYISELTVTKSSKLPLLLFGYPFGKKSCIAYPSKLPYATRYL